MNKNNVLLNIGYVFALICFLTSLFFRFYSNFDVHNEFAISLMNTGSFSLLITSIYKIVVISKTKIK